MTEGRQLPVDVGVVLYPQADAFSLGIAGCSFNDQAVVGGFFEPSEVEGVLILVRDDQSDDFCVEVAAGIQVPCGERRHLACAGDVECRVSGSRREAWVTPCGWVRVRSGLPASKGIRPAAVSDSGSWRGLFVAIRRLGYDLLGKSERFDAGRNASIDGHLNERVLDFGVADTISQGTSHMGFEFVPTAEGSQDR